MLVDAELSSALLLSRIENYTNIMTQHGATQGEGIVVYNYKGTNDDELTMIKGQHITIYSFVRVLNCVCLKNPVIFSPACRYFGSSARCT